MHLPDLWNGVRRRLLGAYLVDTAMVSTAQLQEGLEIQATLRQLGEHHLLGAILRDLGYVTPESVEAAVLRQRDEPAD